MPQDIKVEINGKISLQRYRIYLGLRLRDSGSVWVEVTTTLNPQHSLIILVWAVRVTEVAEEMITSQVAEELVIVHEPGVAELTQGVAPVAAVVCVTLPPVLR